MYLEVIGLVQDSSTIKLAGLIELGDEIGAYASCPCRALMLSVLTDMKLANDMIEQMHRPMFWQTTYGYHSETPA